MLKRLPLKWEVLPRCARNWLNGAFHFWGGGTWASAGDPTAPGHVG